MSKELILGLSLIACSAVSVAISGWQYGVDEGGLKIGYDNFCDSAPFQYARPVYLQGNLQSEPNGDAYCGYSTANTVWRLCSAGFTLIAGLLFCIPNFASSMGKTWQWVLFFVGAMWFCATTSDCTALQMSYGVCRNFFGGPNSRHYYFDPSKTGPTLFGVYSCDYGYYGVTVAMDFVISFIMLGAYLSSSDVAEGYAAPATTADAADAEAADVTKA